jgi:hypothetical protein
MDFPMEYILLQWQTMLNTGYDISFMYEDYSIEEMLNFNQRQITVLFIDENIQNRDKIIQAYVDKGFFLFVYDKNNNDKNCFSNPIQLIDLIIANKTKIETHFSKYGLDIHFNFQNEIPDPLKRENIYEYFLPSLSNFFILNQYIGNLYYDSEYKLTVKDSLTNPSKKLEAHSKRTNRIEIIMKQILNIDKFRIIAASELPFLKKMGDTIPHFTPLIIVSPYQYPQIESIFPGIEKDPEFRWYREAFKTEQDIDYRNQLNRTENNKELLQKIAASANVNHRKMSYLDSVAYLHASYTFSPILRLPSQGRSINRFLSFFNPETSTPSPDKLFASITKFGKEYSKRVLSESNSSKLFKRNRQIVAISDLPIEWMQIDNVPLCVTHDVTRIPEIPYGGIMSFYVRNKIVQYEIPTNVLEKTLVVFGVEGNRHFDIGYEFIKKNSSTFGYKTFHCRSLNALKEEIAEFKPHLIIFDTHGKVNNKEKSSQIQIGEDYLDGNDIIKHNIVAPLIILSACNTVPNWGYFNNIANAFFEAGALSITGTFLPIGIFSGTTFYNRVLINLKQAQTQAIHNNWLNFISHNIRTHYISETMLAAHRIINATNLTESVKQNIDNKISRLAANLMTNAMSFSRRVSVYQNIQQSMINIHPIFKNKKFQIPFEQMLYSNLGRGDLIMFSSWLKENALTQKDFITT